MKYDNNLAPLRGLAAFSVVCHHLYAHASVRVPFLYEAGGLLGVQLFFLISGYLITRSAQAHRFPVYLIHRCARIFPAYWVAVVMVSIGINRLTFFPLPSDWPYALINFFTLSHLSPYALSHYDVLTVSWTLTVEWGWYLLAPVLVCLAPRKNNRRYWLTVGLAVILLSSAWVYMAQKGGLDFLFIDGIGASGDTRGPEFMRFAYITNGAPAHFGFFMLGSLISRFEPQLKRLPYALPLITFFIFVPFFSQWNTWLTLNPSIASGLGLAGLFVLALKLPLLKWKALHQLGELAYPVYLLHVPAIVIVFNLWKLSGFAGIFSFLVLLIVAAYVLHRLVERPGMALGRRLSLRFFPEHR